MLILLDQTKTSLHPILLRSKILCWEKCSGDGARAYRLDRVPSLRVRALSRLYVDKRRLLAEAAWPRGRYEEAQDLIF